VDVGHGQLHPRLRASSQVVCVEKLNARTLTTTDLIAACAVFNWARGLFDTQNEPEQGVFDIIVGDVSFISQTLLIEALVSLLTPQGHMLMLVKPQFELQPEQIGKGGLVKDAAHYVEVEQRIRSSYATQGLQVQHYFESSLVGSDGNREFFVQATKLPTKLHWPTKRITDRLKEPDEPR
jgi:23S rRNA (cytidine1920-2'-O)/16S rRNA (cytidine1409-2'-O)-methyltransferase